MNDLREVGVGHALGVEVRVQVLVDSDGRSKQRKPPVVQLNCPHIARHCRAEERGVNEREPIEKVRRELAADPRRADGGPEHAVDVGEGDLEPRRELSRRDAPREQALRHAQVGLFGDVRVEFEVGDAATTLPRLSYFGGQVFCLRPLFGEQTSGFPSSGRRRTRD